MPARTKDESVSPYIVCALRFSSSELCGAHKRSSSDTTAAMLQAVNHYSHYIARSLTLSDWLDCVAIVHTFRGAVLTLEAVAGHTNHYANYAS